MIIYLLKHKKKNKNFVVKYEMVTNTMFYELNFFFFLGEREVEVV